MSFGQDLPERLIWATRGRSWGFRFVFAGGLRDPLMEYERFFTDLGDEPTAWHRVAGKGALRFPDPEGRRDAAGRVIPHEFVVSGDLATHIRSAEEGRQQVWPLVAEVYARIWDADGPPLAGDLRLATHDDSTRDAPRSALGDGHK